MACPALMATAIAHAPAGKTHAWRSRGGKNSSTAARSDKRIPERLRAAIEALDQGLLDVQEGNLDPAAYSAMCRGAKAIADLYRLADQEMELIRNEKPKPPPWKSSAHTRPRHPHRRRQNLRRAKPV